MTGVIAGYRVLLPEPWVRLPLNQDAHERVIRLVDELAEQHTPAETPPDTVKPLKRRLVQMMTTQIDAARAEGAIDLYVPLDTMHGYPVRASFTVSQTVPDASAGPADAAEVMAALLADGGWDPVPLGEDTWLRARVSDLFTAQDTQEPCRRVTYMTAVPDRPETWVLVSFSVVGAPMLPPVEPPPDVIEPLAEDDLMVQLFDAIMTTWTWHRVERPPT